MSQGTVGWAAEIRESIRSRPNYYGCPKILTIVNFCSGLVVGCFVNIPGTLIPTLVMTVPCSICIHLWAAWVTHKHPFMFTILWRRLRYALKGSRIGRHHV
jgi:hypothetical protein